MHQQVVKMQVDLYEPFRAGSERVGSDDSPTTEVDNSVMVISSGGGPPTVAERAAAFSYTNNV